MGEESGLNQLLFNLLNENRFSHCRMCLNLISDSYVRFCDLVCIDDSNSVFKEVYEIVSSVLELQGFEEIAGIDALCKGCLDEALICYKFQEKFSQSNELLNNLLENISQTCNLDTETVDQDSNLYITVNENECKLIFVHKDAKLKATTKKNVQCLTCFEEFNDETELREHHTEVHQQFFCMKCFDTVKDYVELVEHYNSKLKFKCPSCDEVRCTKASLLQHQDIHEFHMCQTCGKSYTNLTALQQHEQKHKDICECPKCGKSYQTKAFYANHVKLCLENQLDPHPQRSKIVKTHVCKECGKGYSTFGGLRVHNRFVHGNAKPHVCEYCNKTFTAPSYLKSHMVTHTKEKKFKCDLCNKKFVSKEALLYHTRRHTGVKPYSCTMCDEKFVNGSARAEHIKFKHQSPDFVCEICSRRFFTKNTLKVHMDKHMDPSNKLYIHRHLIPPNVPRVENIKLKSIAKLSSC